MRGRRESKRATEEAGGRRERRPQRHGQRRQTASFLVIAPSRPVRLSSIVVPQPGLVILGMSALSGERRTTASRPQKPSRASAIPDAARQQADGCSASVDAPSASDSASTTDGSRVRSATTPLNESAKPRSSDEHKSSNTRSQPVDLRPCSRLLRSVPDAELAHDVGRARPGRAGRSDGCKVRLDEVWRREQLGRRKMKRVSDRLESRRCSRRKGLREDTRW